MSALIFRICIYVVLGVLLVAANLWYFSSLSTWLYRVVNGHQKPRLILPFQVVGKPDDGKLGLVLAQMLAARLTRIQKEMDDTDQALRLADPGQTTDARHPQDIGGPRRITLGLGGTPLPPIDLKMSVGGVELNGLLAWAQRMVNEEDGLRLSVTYDGNKAVVAGDPGHDEHPYWIECPESNRELVSKVAYALAHRRFNQTVKNTEALTADEFEALVTTLTKAAELNRLLAGGRAPASTEYAPLVEALDELVKKSPSWRALIHVAAELAENSKKPEQALHYYRLEENLVPTTKLTKAEQEAKDRLAAKIATLQHEIDAQRRETAARVMASPVPSTAVPEPTTPSGRILQLVGVPNLEMKASPKIAVLGAALRRETLPDVPREIIGGADVTTDPAAEEYTATVVQSVLLVAPKAQFLFTNTRVVNQTIADGDILRSLNLFLEAKPDILLVTYGPFASPVYQRVFEKFAAEGTIVILAAGNEPGRPISFARQPLLDQIMVVAAVDEEGMPASFTQFGEKCFWAPGTGVPVVLPRGVDKTQMRVELRSGTSYAAGVAAGVVARVLAVHKIPPDKLIAHLRATSQQKGKVLDDSLIPPILNLETALKKIGK